MIARIDSTGLQPLEIACKFAIHSFDKPRFVDLTTFYGEHSWAGFAGSFMLLEGVGRYGVRWFKRRGRMFAFYRLNEPSYNHGKIDASGGKPPDFLGETPWDQVSYLDGYLSGIPRKLKAERRREIETSIYTEIDSLLYS